MEATCIGFDPQNHFQVGGEKMREEVKFLQELVQLCCKITENAAMLQEITPYVQQVSSLSRNYLLAKNPRLEYDTENLFDKEEITPNMQQNTHCERTLNQENEVANPNREKSSPTKRRKTSKVWEEFTTFVEEDGKELATCNHCNRKFNGSSKKGTTHLRNHLERCPSKRTSFRSAAMEKGISERLREKDLEIESMKCANEELMNRVNQKDLQIESVNQKNEELLDGIKQKDIQIERMSSKNEELMCKVYQKERQIESMIRANEELLDIIRLIDFQIETMSGRNEELMNGVNQKDPQIGRIIHTNEELLNGIRLEDFQMEMMSGRNEELMNRITQLLREANIWKCRARSSQYVFDTLQSIRQQINLRFADQFIDGGGESEVVDSVTNNTPNDYLSIPNSC